MSAERLTYLWGPEVGPARAAAGTFPYDHRTIAEIDAEEEALQVKCAASMKGPNSLDRSIGLTSGNWLKPTIFATQPTSSCPRCGARGYCGHNGRVAA